MCMNMQLELERKSSGKGISETRSRLSRQVVSLYLDYLEKAFFVKKLYNFSRNLRKQKRSMKKYYPAITFPIIEDT